MEHGQFSQDDFDNLFAPLNSEEQNAMTTSEVNRSIAEIDDMASIRELEQSMKVTDDHLHAQRQEPTAHARPTIEKRLRKILHSLHKIERSLFELTDKLNEVYTVLTEINGEEID